MLYETDGNGALQVRYTYGTDYKPVAMIRDGNTYYFHYNGHGDVVALTDSTGAVVAEYDYDAYGSSVTTGREGTVVNPYKYAGYRYDSETGFYYLNARYYWPAVGRFITRDTFQGIEDDPGSLNQYAYARNNPILFLDPSGFAYRVWCANNYCWYEDVVQYTWSAYLFAHTTRAVISYLTGKFVSIFEAVPKYGDFIAAGVAYILGEAVWSVPQVGSKFTVTFRRKWGDNKWYRRAVWRSPSGYIINDTKWGYYRTRA